ncbi:hypothetical protein D3C78_1283690 [compost metagenome]
MRLEGGLARWSLSLTSLQDTAHDDFIDVLGEQARALHSGTYGHCAKLCGGELLEVTEKAAQGSASGADDDDRICVAHVYSSIRWPSGP